jgi:hypothetical protein
MSINHTVSSKVDTMLRSADNTAIRSNIEAAFVDDVDSNTSDIASLTSSLSTTNGNVTTNTGNIATNTSNITTNTGNITTNTGNIATNTSNIATNTSNIATNTSGVSTNATNIATNASGISTNASAIATNTSGVATNASNITTNTSNISTNTSDIATNTSAIATNTSDISTNTADIATNTSAIATNTSDISTNSSSISSLASSISTNASSITTNASSITTNASNIATKAPIADPDFTGTVGIEKSGVNGVLDIDGDVYIENGKINGDTGSIDFDNNQAQLILGTSKSDAVKIERVDASNTLIFGVDASSATTGKATMLNAEVSNDLTVNGSANIQSIESNADIELDASQEVIVNGNCSVVGDLSVAGDHTINTGKLIAREIQCEGSTTATALPIKYDSNEHRFRDYDADPTNLMVIKKIDDKNGARIGVNVPDNNTPRCALEIVYGSSEDNSGTDTTNRETLRVMGGSFFNEWTRVGHYTGTDPSDAPVGSIIYRSDTKTFKGNCGSDGWKTFTMS